MTLLLMVSPVVTLSGGSSLTSVKGLQYVCPHPCTQRLVIRVEKNDNNRALIVTLDSDDYFRESSFGIDPQAAPVRDIEFRDIPTGDYVLSVALIRLKNGHPDRASLLQMNFHVL